MLASHFLRDPVSSLTHLSAAVFSVGLTAILLRLAGVDRVKRISLTVFGTSAALLYTASGVYHAVQLPPDSPALDWLRRMDHSAIYLLIAGTYTPVFAVLTTGAVRIWLLLGIWTCAAAGIAAKWIFSVDSQAVSVPLYLAMGWFAVGPMFYMVRQLGWRVLIWSAGGGLMYTAGAIFEVLQWPVLVPGLIGWHEVFHVCVMIATAMHVVFMVQVVLPFHPEMLAQPAKRKHAA